MLTTGFSEAIADRIAAEHALLAARWFARLRDLLPVDANEVFPSDSLLDHIPSLIVDVSAYLKAPEDGAIAANTLVVAKAAGTITLAGEQAFAEAAGALLARGRQRHDANYLIRHDQPRGMSRPLITSAVAFMISSSRGFFPRFISRSFRCTLRFFFFPLL